MSKSLFVSIAVGNVTFVLRPNEENTFPKVSTNRSNLFPNFYLVNEIKLHMLGWVSKLE